MASQPIDATLYADPQGLSGLRRGAKAQDPASIREAARQFEGIFTNMMLKSMRQATPKDALMGSDQQDMYQDMFDQQLAQKLSAGKGLGLADMLVRQLMQASGIDAPTAPGATGTDGATPAGGLKWPPANRQEFIARLRPAAEAAGKELGVDPDTLIAHAALETGWGKSLPTSGDGNCSFNLFGIKSGSRWTGDSVNALTTEYEGNVATPRFQQFRSYASPEECMQDYTTLLSKPRYADALGTGDDAGAFATALQRGGYATDPDYAAKLTAVARELKSSDPLPLTQSQGSGHERY